MQTMEWKGEMMTTKPKPKKKSEQNIESTHLWRFIFIPFFFLFIFQCDTHASLCVCFTHNFLLFNFFSYFIPFTRTRFFLSLSVYWRSFTISEMKTKKWKKIFNKAKRFENMATRSMFHTATIKFQFHNNFIVLAVSHRKANISLQVIESSSLFYLRCSLCERKYICFLIASTTLSLRCWFIIGNQQNQFCIFLSLISIIVVRAT